ncbi:hypothetical protein Hanom_Chr16g01471381 [Helianthus anomalus]
MIVRLSPTLRASLDALNYLISCYVISLQILKNLNFTSNHTNILIYPYIFHIITLSSLNLIT